METIDFVIGFITGAVITGAIALRLKIELTKDIDKLKDFDNWKEWKSNPEILEKWMIEDTVDK